MVCRLHSTCTLYTQYHTNGARATALLHGATAQQHTTVLATARPTTAAHRQHTCVHCTVHTPSPLQQCLTALQSLYQSQNSPTFSNPRLQASIPRDGCVATGSNVCRVTASDSSPAQPQHPRNSKSSHRHSWNGPQRAGEGMTMLRQQHAVSRSRQ